MGSWSFVSRPERTALSREVQGPHRRFLLPHRSHTVARAARQKLATTKYEDAPDFHRPPLSKTWEKGERRWWKWPVGDLLLYTSEAELPPSFQH